MSYRPITADELVAFHDRLEQTAAGLPGIADRSKAQAVIDRITTLYLYGELPDIWHVAAAHLQAVARGHIFADYNKRTAMMTLGVFLRRNGILLNPQGNALEELTVNTATGELQREQIAAELKRLSVTH
ncbi:type II toxin-antitoxin system death-on-curing family toxin [Salmonella enterica]|nr:type II toxin-antitoxin system death-on-curing family toxin [Salmonella enterica]EKK6596287.1 type II toxin-antitoxin system death-on-curing family toxin [Salmonella enterica]